VLPIDNSIDFPFFGAAPTVDWPFTIVNAIFLLIQQNLVEKNTQY
jgi:hypothetical protein